MQLIPHKQEAFQARIYVRWDKFEFTKVGSPYMVYMVDLNKRELHVMQDEFDGTGTVPLKRIDCINNCIQNK